MKKEKIDFKIEWLLNHLWQRDKLYHLIVGTLIYIAGALIFAPYVGLLLAILGGFAKEFHDEFIRTKIVNGKKLKHQMETLGITLLLLCFQLYYF
jgi:ABC-type phosphate transport system permease subunit